MNKTIAGALGASVLLIGTSGGARADGVGGLFGALFDGPSLKPPSSEDYVTECGSCHLAFPPELLTAEAWARVMGTLKNHFGDDVSLASHETKEVSSFLAANAAKTKRDEHSPAVGAKTGAAKEPPRITDTVYFQGRHNEISARYVKSNPKIGSFANCQACHLGADKGSFNEAELTIPKMEKALR
jgi:hypothetical protein